MDALNLMVMTKKRILIVEDEALTAQHMRLVLEENNYEIAGIVDSGVGAIDLFKKNHLDLVLMDIQITGGIDGITTAKRLQEVDSIPIIFITQITDQEVFKAAKMLFPENYLTKPFTDNMLVNVVELAIQNFSRRRERWNADDAVTQFDGIFIPFMNGTKIKVLFKDILYIRAERAYSRIYVETPNGDGALETSRRKKKRQEYHEVSMNSAKLFEQLNHNSIIRVHKSFYVNIDKVNKMSANSLFINDVSIPIGAAYNGDEIKKKLKTLRFDY